MPVYPTWCRCELGFVLGVISGKTRNDTKNMAKPGRAIIKIQQMRTHRKQTEKERLCLRDLALSISILPTLKWSLLGAINGLGKLERGKN